MGWREKSAFPGLQGLSGTILISLPLGSMKSVWRQSHSLLRLYWELEGQSRQTLSGVFLYVMVIILVTSYLFGAPEGKVWLGVFWMILLFSAVNVGVLSFVQETGGRRWYYYQLAEPVAVYLAKVAYIFILLLLVSMMTVLLLGMFYGWPFQQPGYLISAILLASLGLAFLFGFLAAIGSQARNSATLSTVISFPLLIGLTMLASKVSEASLLTSFSGELLNMDYLMFIGLDLMIGGLGVLLFAYIWRD